MKTKISSNMQKQRELAANSATEEWVWTAYVSPPRWTRSNF